MIFFANNFVFIKLFFFFVSDLVCKKRCVISFLMMYSIEKETIASLLGFNNTYALVNSDIFQSYRKIPKQVALCIPHKAKRVLSCVKIIFKRYLFKSFYPVLIVNESRLRQLKCV